MVIIAARYLGVDPRSLEHSGMDWVHLAIAMRNAEAEAKSKD